HHVEQHDVGRECSGELERGAAVGRGAHVVALGFEEAGEQLQATRVVVDDEHACRRVRIHPETLPAETRSPGPVPRILNLGSGYARSTVGPTLRLSLYTRFGKLNVDGVPNGI